LRAAERLRSAASGASIALRHAETLAPLVACIVVLGRRFAKAENISVGVLNVEVLTGPRPFFKRSGDQRATRLQFIMQCRYARYTDVRIQVFLLLAVCSVADRLRSTFKMNCKAVATHAGIERLVA